MGAGARAALPRRSFSGGRVAAPGQNTLVWTMAYILLAIGIIITLAAAHRFLTRATRKQVGTLVVILGTLSVSGLVFLLAITGRLPAFIGGIAALCPLVYSLWESHKHVKREEKIYQDISNSPINVTSDEAREILGVSENADRDEIEAAYKRLLKKIHPDSGGSAWMTRKLLAARDQLLKSQD